MGRTCRCPLTVKVAFRGLHGTLVVRTLLGGRPKVFLGIPASQSNGNDIHGVNYTYVICDFAVSSPHDCLTSASDVENKLTQNEVYADALMLASSADSLYSVFKVNSAHVLVKTEAHL